MASVCDSAPCYRKPQWPGSQGTHARNASAPPLPSIDPLRAAPPRQTVGRWAAIALSDNHAAGLSGEGSLYTWGANNRGQLGHGDKCPGAIDAPVQVSTLSDSDVK